MYIFTDEIDSQLFYKRIVFQSTSKFIGALIPTGSVETKPTQGYLKFKPVNIVMYLLQILKLMGFESVGIFNINRICIFIVPVVVFPRSDTIALVNFGLHLSRKPTYARNLKLLLSLSFLAIAIRPAFVIMLDPKKEYDLHK